MQGIPGTDYEARQASENQMLSSPDRDEMTDFGSAAILWKRQGNIMYAVLKVRYQIIE